MGWSIWDAPQRSGPPGPLPESALHTSSPSPSCLLACTSSVMVTERGQLESCRAGFLPSQDVKGGEGVVRPQPTGPRGFSKVAVPFSIILLHPPCCRSSPSAMLDDILRRSGTSSSHTEDCHWGSTDLSGSRLRWGGRPPAPLLPGGPLRQRRDRSRETQAMHAT